MSGSNRIAQAPLGLGQLWAALVAITLVIVLAAAVVLGQLAGPKAQAAPAGGAVPVVDRGAMEGPAYTAPDGSGSGGSNGTRFAQ